MSHKFLKKLPGRQIAMLVGLVLVIGAVGYLNYALYIMKVEKSIISGEKVELEASLQAYYDSVSKLKHRNAEVSQALQTEKANSDFFAGQIQNIAGTVGTLEKLSRTDPELLKKYSKVYFLNENYIPEKLTDIPLHYMWNKERGMQIHTEVWPHLQKLLDTASSTGIALQIISAYRSFGTQAILKSSYKIIYGTGTANKFSADQGYSEHQLGTTLDFTTPSIGAAFIGFEKTETYKWLLENAHKYGFIVSYPKENTYYSFEPWHFRFVGVSLATAIYNAKTYFYALDQREIDQYLISLFD